MKSLYFFRHAKSSWEDTGLTDEERPILPSGIEKTGKIIHYLNKHQVTAGSIISSPAVRALETARLVARGIGFPEESIIVDRKIYEGYYDSILDLIYTTSDSVDSLMIFGHNPSVTQLVNLFLHPGIEAMPTSAVVKLCFDVSQWKSIPSADARLEYYVTPKTLK